MALLENFAMTILFFLFWEAGKVWVLFCFVLGFLLFDAGVDAVVLAGLEFTVQN